jgi:hypothetical protein
VAVAIVALIKFRPPTPASSPRARPLNVSRQAFDIYPVFFGLWLTLIGYLIVRSAFIAAVAGVLAMCGGVCYLTLLALATAGRGSRPLMSQTASGHCGSRMGSPARS